ncbi:MAG: hypothetical protein J6B09_02380 [Clostridia bacterium]|nr:hypothetical protein [Clostridia bacterium]
MTSKERVLTALHHVRPDRVPINFRATDILAERLKKRHACDDLLEHYKVDFREIVVPYTGPVFERTPDNTWLDEWGVRRKEAITKTSRDVYIDLNPLGDIEDADDIEKLLAYPWPSPDQYDFSVAEAMCDRYKDYAICGPGMHCEGYHGIFHQLTYMFGMEQAMCLLVTEEELMKTALRCITDYWLGYYDRLLSAAKGKIDLIFYKDDMGSQDSLLISPEMYKTYFAPSLKELCDLADSYGATMIYHSCGSVVPLIPEFQKCGVKVLDPIQTSASNMDISMLKNTFGDQLTFHGAIDTQQDLPRKSADEIRELVKKTISVLGKNGGYFFSPSHRIQQDTPLENIDAMYDVALNWNEY